MDLQTQKMFADILNGLTKNKVSPYETTATVTSVTDDIIYVDIPGCENPIPVKNSTVKVKAGDVVNVSISHGDTHITGNRTDVSASSSDVTENTKKIENNKRDTDNRINMIDNDINLINNNINIQRSAIEAIDSKVDLQGSKIETVESNISTLDSTVKTQGSNIETLNSTVQTHGSTIETQGSKISTLESTVQTQGSNIETLNSTVQTQGSKVDTLESTVQTQGSTIETLGSTVQTQGSTIETLGSTVQTQGSSIETLNSTVETQGTSIETLDSSIKIVNSAFIIQNGKMTGISEILTKILDSDYVKTDLLNADVAWIEDGKIKEGAIGTVEIHDSSITTAKISELSADVIKTGTLKTECLILTTDEVDPKTGEKKVALITALNAKTKAGEGNILDGAVIKDETIEAAKITVVDLNAFGATIGNFHIGTSSIYNNKTALTDPTDGVYIGTDGIALGQGSLLNMTDDSPFRVESNGDFHLGGKDSNYVNFDPFAGNLDINADNIKIGSSSVASQSYVDQKAEGITATVGDVNDRLTTMEQNADGFTWSIDQTAIVSSVNEYYPSTSATELTGGSWSENTPTWTQGTYIWLRIKTTNGKGKIDYSKPVCITGNTGAQGAKGDTGEQGPKGEKGDTGEQGPRGLQGLQGEKGAQGETGADGRGISSTEVTYQAGSSGTTVPTGTWSPNVPSVSAGQYLWTKTVTTYTSGNPTTAYSVGRMGTNGQNGTNGTNGTDGKGIKSTDITYKAWPSGTTTPTGTWSTSVPSTTADEPYLWTKTVITYTDNTTSTSYSVGSTPEGIVVGGRNMCIGTNQGTKNWRWSMRTGSYTNEEVLENGIRTCKMTRGDDAQSGWSFIAFKDISRDKWLPDTDYIITVEVKSNFNATFTLYGLAESNGTGNLSSKINVVNNKTKAGEWVTLQWLCKTLNPLPTQTNQILYMNNMNSEPGVYYQFRNLKIEKGNKATDWSPAPEDVEADAAAKSENAKSEAITAAAADATNKANEAAKTATNYMKFSSDGLTISKDATTASTGRNLNITDKTVNIRNGSEVLASYGEEIVLRNNGNKSFIVRKNELVSQLSMTGYYFEGKEVVKYDPDDNSIMTITLDISGGNYYYPSDPNLLLIWRIQTINRYVIFRISNAEKEGGVTHYTKMTKLRYDYILPNHIVVYDKNYNGKTWAYPCTYFDDNATDVNIIGSLHLTNNGNIQETVAGCPPLLIGKLEGKHVEFSNDAIIAKADSNTPDILHLGGSVQIHDQGDKAIMIENSTLYAKNTEGQNAVDPNPWIEILGGYDIAGEVNLGYGGYKKNKGKTNVYGKEVDLIGSTKIISKAPSIETTSTSSNKMTTASTKKSSHIEITDGNIDISANDKISLQTVNADGISVKNGNLIFDRSYGLSGYNTSGVLRKNIKVVDNNNNFILGYDSYMAHEGATYIHGNEIWIETHERIRSLRHLRTLWTGAHFMNDNQTATLSDKVTNQLNGIVLVWSYYNSGAENYWWNFTFVPKEFVSEHGGNGVGIILYGSPLGVKYVYINDNTINGARDNESSSTNISGVTFKPNVYVLREVWGV